MQIKPISDHILIEPLRSEEKSKGGILLPETAEKEGPEQGRVMAVGPGKKSSAGQVIPLEIRPGNRILFNMDRFSSNKIKIDNKEYLIIKEEDVLAILE